MPDNAQLPLEIDLDKLFSKSTTLDSARDWRDAGFEIMRGDEGKIIVASHRSVRGFLFKKYERAFTSYDEELELYEERVNGARLLKDHLDAHHVEKIVVPRKWLCTLPSRDKARGKPTYVIIVDRYDLLDRDESERLYRRIDRKVLKDLCTILFLFRGLDFSLRNVPFTRSGEIAFIDTEHIKLTKKKKLLSRRDSYEQNLSKLLSDSDRRFALSLWDDFVKRKDLLAPSSKR